MIRLRLTIPALFVICFSACSENDATDLDGIIGMRVSPDSALLLAGDTVQLNATVSDSRGQSLSRTVLWISADSSIASVTASGRVLAKRRGNVAIMARAGTALDTAKIVVDSVVEVRLSKATATLVPGDSLQLTTSIMGASGATFRDRTVVWSSSNDTVVSVTSGGRVVARSVGTARITASLSGMSGTAYVFVSTTALNAQAVCAPSGTPHSGVVETETWRAAGNPHILVDSVMVTNKLTIEAGAVVCGMPGSALMVNTPVFKGLMAVGTPAQPIRFTATDVTKPWNGILLRGFAGGGDVTLVHAIVEFASSGLDAASFNQIQIRIEDSKFRQASVKVFGNFVTADILRTVIDTGNVTLASGTFEDNIIRGGALRVGLAIDTLRHGVIAVNGGRIEGSPGIAFSVGTRGGIPPVVTSSKPLRIIGSRGYPVDAPLSIFAAIWPTRAAQDNLLGNSNDTLHLWSLEAPNAAAHVRRDLPWLVDVSPLMRFGFDIKELTIEPGASLHLLAPITASGKVTAIGTAQDPIRITGPGPTPISCGITLKGSAASTFTNVIFSDTCLRATQQHSAQVQRINTNEMVELSAPGSRIVDAEIHDVRGGAMFSATNAALRIAASDVQADRVIVRRASGTSYYEAGKPVVAVMIAASNVQLQNCDIVDNERDGVRIMSGANVQIRNCNIERNGDFGVNNLGASLVDARGTWWGDPQGPFGPGGDRISGNIDFAEWLLYRRDPLN